MKRLKNIHPGEILREEYFKPLGINKSRFAYMTGIERNRLCNILLRKADINAETDILLHRVLKTSKGFWLHLQVDYDIEKAEIKLEQKQKILKKKLKEIS